MSETRTGGRPLELFREHMALVASVVLAAFIAMRLHAVSGGSLQTAWLILGTQGTANVVFGSAVALVPLAPLWAAQMWFLFVLYGRGRFPWESGTVWPLALLALPALFVTPAAGVLLAVVPPLLIGLAYLVVSRVLTLSLSRARKNVSETRSSADDADADEVATGQDEVSDPVPEALRRYVDEADTLVGELEKDHLPGHLALPARADDLRRRFGTYAATHPSPENETVAELLAKLSRVATALRGRAEARRLFVKRVVVVSALSLLGGSAFSNEPWLAREHLTSGSVEIVGYVLEDEPDGLLVLKHEPRVVVRLPATSEREYCIDPGPSFGLFRWLFALRQPIASWSAFPTYPPCPPTER